MNKGWLRYGLASMTLLSAGLAGFVVACGDDDNGTVAGQDAGNNQDSASPEDGGGKDEDAGKDSGPATPNAKIQLVNAATDFGPSNPVGAIRVCYGLGPTTIAPLPPLPDRKANAAQPFPGVYIGTGGAVQGTGADLTAIPIVPYLLNAQTLAERGVVKPDAGAGVSCADLIGAASTDAGGEMIEGKDYWKLPEIPAGTFTKGKSIVLVLTGCAGDSTKGAAKCGPDFTQGAPGNGNLKVTVFEVDRTTAIDAQKIGTQFIHASPAGASYLQALPGGGLQVVPGYISDPATPSTFKGVSGSDGGTSVGLLSKTDLVQVDGVNVANDSFTANPNVQALAIKLSTVQLASYGGNVPTGGDYRNGAAFTFVALGDPDEPATVGGQPNTKTFHYIALPNDAVNEVYKP